MHCSTVFAAGAAVLSAVPLVQAGLYPKSSPVLQVDAKTYQNLIAKSNHTSIVEYYAPWCGHCQKLKPIYEKAARNLNGLAKVAGVNCDDEENKSFCGRMGVQGFPTLKIVRPGTKSGKPVVEDYQGPRTASGIVEAVVEKINNHVKRVTDQDLDSFLKGNKPKALLFTEKGTTGALLRSIAIDFLDVVAVGQVRNKEAKAVEKFGIKSFPTFVLLPGGDKDPIIYDGELKKDGMLAFISQVASPNPDAAPKADKGKKTDKKAAEKAAKEAAEKAAKEAAEKAAKEAAEKAAKEAAEKVDEEDAEQADEDETITEFDIETEGPDGDAAQKPMVNEAAPIIADPPLPIADTPEKLQAECLSASSHTCVLAFVPTTEKEKAAKALTTLSELAKKYADNQRKIFPFFSVPEDNAAAPAVTKALGLAGDIEIVAVNARRGWWRHYEGDFDVVSVESWIDAIRLGEGSKQKLPESIVVEDAKVEPAEESTASSSATEPEIEMEEIDIDTETEEIELDTETEEIEVETEAPVDHDEL